MAEAAASKPVSREDREAREVFRRGMAQILDLIAPAAFLITPTHLQVGSFYTRTLFAFTYPRFLQANWLSPIINLDATSDLALFIYPIQSKEVMMKLRKRLGQLESTARIEHERGQVRDPELETAMADIEDLRDRLARGEAKLFQLGLYITLYAKSLEELDELTEHIESIFGAALVGTKPAILQMEQGFNATLPLADDQLQIWRNMDTGALSACFPFTSATLTQGEGVLYGLNRHNNSLIIFDRFSMENANFTIFGKSGSGKSYFVKLETLRSLMFGSDVIVIDPENEYQRLCEAVGGGFLTISVKSERRINPFDLPPVGEGESGADVLNEKILDLKGLIALMAGGSLTPDEDAILDRALLETYALKDITQDPASHQNPPPILEDFLGVLANIRGAETLVRRLRRFVEGPAAPIFNRPSNFEMKPGLSVFSLRDLDEAYRPIMMYVILHALWRDIKMNLRRRLVVIDEAWHLMQYEDSARFVFSLAKRARKYYVGLTVITQDVEDFLGSRWGQAVVSNSSLQLILKQSPASVGKVAEVFRLTEGEKHLLLEADVGEGLFFAGLNHVAIKVIASPTEDVIITSDPRELLTLRAALGPTEKAAQPPG